MQNSVRQSCGIVLEGGGMRGMFTCGVIDVLMENHIRFDALAGVSAGVLFGCNYKSEQIGRGLRYNLRYKDDKRYMSWHSLFRTGNFLNTQFAYHDLPAFLDPFDWQTFEQNPMRFFVVCTDIVNGTPFYKEITTHNADTMQWFRASGSMPLFAQPVHLEGHTLLDGGISDSIPLRFIQNQGYERNFVVLTQPKGYRKKPAHFTPLFRLFLHKYPQVATLMRQRHLMYNAQLDELEQQVAQGNTLALYPEQPLNIGRIEQNEHKMKAIYQQGRQQALKMLPQIKEFIKR